MLMRNPDFDMETQEQRRADVDLEQEEPDRDHELARELFHNTKIRHSFIQKVFSIVLIQLAVTSCSIAVFTLVDDAKQYAQQHIWLNIGSALAALGVLIVMICGPESFRKKFPTNCILLGIFTVLMAISVGCSSSYRASEAVLFAAITCLVIVLVVTLFAFQTKIDITDKGNFFCVLLAVVFVMGICVSIAAVFFAGTETFKYIYLVYCCIGVIVFTGLLFFDVQLLIGGNHKYAITPDDYVFAALSIYLDIINIFLFLLSIFDTKF